MNINNGMFQNLFIQCPEHPDSPIYMGNVVGPYLKFICLECQKVVKEFGYEEVRKAREKAAKEDAFWAERMLTKENMPEEVKEIPLCYNYQLNPENILGTIDCVSIKDNEINIEGELNKNPKCEVFDDVNICKTFKTEIGGKILERDEKDPKIIKKMELTHITLIPCNENNFRIIEDKQKKED